MIDSTPRLKKEDTLKIIINNHLDYSVTSLIKNGLKEEHDKDLSRYFYNNLTQISYFIIGVLILFISTLLEKSILKEIIVIGGWVFIWEMVELEIITDINNRKRRKILRKILNSEFNEIKK